MKTILLSVTILFSFASFGQNVFPKVVNTTGGSYQKGYYALDWSIGELPMVEPLTCNDHSFIITNGFLQAHTDAPHVKDTLLAFTKDELYIFPNPTRGKLEVNFLLREQGVAKLLLYDATGRLLQNTDVSLFGYGKFERIDISRMANSTYFLYIELTRSSGSVVKKGIYKISKIQ
jgi:hypothetical protein